MLRLVAISLLLACTSCRSVQAFSGPRLAPRCELETVLRPGPALASGAILSSEVEVYGRVHFTIRALLVRPEGFDWQDLSRSARSLASSSESLLLAPRKLRGLESAFLEGPELPSLPLVSSQALYETQSLLLLETAASGISLRRRSNARDRPILEILAERRSNQQSLLSIELKEAEAFEIAVLNWPDNAAGLAILVPMKLLASEPGQANLGPLCIILTRAPLPLTLSSLEQASLADLKKTSPFAATGSTRRRRPALDDRARCRVSQASLRALTGSTPRSSAQPRPRARRNADRATLRQLYRRAASGHCQGWLRRRRF